MLLFIPFLGNGQAQYDFFTPDTNEVVGVRFTLSYTSRLSIVNDSQVGIRGIHSGVKFGKNRHRLTLAYFWSNTNPNVQLLDFDVFAEKLLDLDAYLKKDFHYYNLMFYPYWLNSARWKLSSPIEIGIGSFSSRGAGFLRELQPFKKDEYFIPFQVGAYLEFKATRYIGLNFEVGQRFILKEKNSLFDLRGPYYGLGANIYTGAIWRDLKSLKSSN